MPRDFFSKPFSSKMFCPKSAYEICQWENVLKLVFVAFSPWTLSNMQPESGSSEPIALIIVFKDSHLNI